MDKFFDLKYQERKLSKNIAGFAEIDQRKIMEAYRMAARHHRGQERDEGGPYILHGLRVANYLLELLNIKNADIICAALLHDTVEETPLSLKTIEKEFGQKVAMMVDSLTREKLPDETEENKYQRKYEFFLKSLKKDLDVRSIKSCDWLDNMTSWPRISLSHPSTRKFTRWLIEAQEMYLPMAKTVSPTIVKKMEFALDRFGKKLKV